MNIGDELCGVVRGTALAAGDHGFGQARRPWNLAVDRPVRAVVEAADADDVGSLVRHARLMGPTVATRPSGHGATGKVDDVVLLRTSRLSELDVRPDQRPHPSDSAGGHLTEPFALYRFGIAGERSAEVRARQPEIASAVVPYPSGRKPFTFIAPGERAANALAGDAVARLGDLKRSRDPVGVLRSNFPVE